MRQVEVDNAHVIVGGGDAAEELSYGRNAANDMAFASEGFRQQLPQALVAFNEQDAHFPTPRGSQ